jgi:predicted DsbA family dithiol-disulfide isomerase
MSTTLQIDMVSDVSCPWCAVGLGALQVALDRLGDSVQANLQFQPFELNPHMGEGGQDITEHLTQKYGSTPQEQAETREHIRQRGQEVGFTFRPEGRGRIYNTFDAHRLLHWAGLEGAEQQLALKKALLAAYFTHGQSPADHAVLVQAAQSAGLDTARASEVLQSDTYAAEVRTQQQYYAQAGIRSVPAFIINNQYLLSGAQPVAYFEQALRQITQEQALA